MDQVDLIYGVTQWPIIPLTTHTDRGLVNVKEKFYG